jgi:uroporphyrinogen decarboxylase
MITHEERLKLCLAGERVDRAPVALWRHFPVEDDSPGKLASAVIQFQTTYDFDFVKVTPASSFCIKGWGAIDLWKGNPEGSKEFIDFPVKQPGDWSKLHRLSSSKGSLASQLECIRMVKQGLPAGTPIIQTIFSPLSQAKNLVGRSLLPIHLRQYPDALHAALRTITDTTIEFVNLAANEGIDGIFFAVQHAQASILSPDEFDTFAVPYDLEILEQAKGLWLNVTHIHGTDVYFDKVARYPVNVLNWHDLETPPDLETGKKEFIGAVCGGLRQWDTLVNGNPQQVEAEAQSAIKKTDSNRFILGTGCVLPVTAPHSNILAARKVVELV